MANSATPSPFSIVDEPTLDLKDLAVAPPSSGYRLIDEDDVENNWTTSRRVPGSFPAIRPSANDTDRIDFYDEDADLDFAGLMRSLNYHVHNEEPVNVDPAMRHKRRLVDAAHIAFLAPNLLTRGECQGLINYAESKTFDPVSRQYLQHVRDGSRRLIRAPRIADALFQRLLPLLRREDYCHRIPLCFDRDGGVWTPKKCNDVIKIVKYTDTHGEGDAFAAHRDGPWIPREQQASIFTVIIYLNEACVGGHTKLLGDVHGADYAISSDAGAPFIVPTTGMGLVFNHDCLHAAAPIRSGVKYILRTEIIFQRSGVYSGLTRYAYLNDHMYIKCKQLYEASQAAGKAAAGGDEEAKKQFFEQYQRVVAIQQRASLEITDYFLGAESNYVRSSLICSNPRATAKMDAQTAALAAQRPRLSEGPLSVALEFVPDADLATLLRTCKAMHHLVSISSMWRSRCLTRFGELFARQMRVAVPSDLEQHLPWLAMYRREKLWQQRLTSFAVWPSTLGGTVNWTDQCTPYQGRIGFPIYVELDKLSSVLAKPTPSPRLPMKTFAGLLPAYYDGGLSPVHLCLPDGMRHTTRNKYASYPWQDYQDCVVRADGSVLWEMLPMSLASACDTQSNVMLLVDAPQWCVLESDAERQRLRNDATRECFDVFACPGVACLSVEECFRARWAYQHGCRTDQIPTVRVVLVYPMRAASSHTHTTSAMSTIVLNAATSSSALPLSPWRLVSNGEELDTWPEENIVVVDAFLAVSSVSMKRPAGNDVSDDAKRRWPTVSPTYVTEGALLISMAPDFRYTRICFRPTA